MRGDINLIVFKGETFQVGGGIMMATIVLDGVGHMGRVRFWHGGCVIAVRGMKREEHGAGGDLLAAAHAQMRVTSVWDEGQRFLCVHGKVVGPIRRGDVQEVGKKLMIVRPFQRLGGSERDAFG